MSVTARIEPKVIPTYPLGEPEKNPLFFEKRVYQGSNGKVYPVPFVDKVYDEPVDTTYQSVLLENDFIRLVMLPEIGGRIFLGQDKKNNDYDFFYRQDVIKPALVGLAGPWISGGVEFNWPQHHRPGTYMPADVHIEEEEDGARTVWMSEHDPINRLKGMHGIRVRPGSSLIELRARLYNRTPYTQTFLWWANVAAEVHDQYQSFFPTDVHYVADHAVRATSSFPVANNPYYDIDYQDRPGENDLSWYKNIPVPTSYMVCQTEDDFFGGYDFKANGGFVHVANRHIAPGKKQWTWGNDEFGWAWDRELTDEGGPYVELMAGVFTDNQPDFTYLAPYETKTFSQYWWPIQNIGPVQQATTKAALACAVEDNVITLGLCVSETFEDLQILVTYSDKELAKFTITLTPGESWADTSLSIPADLETDLTVLITSADGENLLSYQPVDQSTLTQDREQATEPPAAEEIDTSDELFFTGEHLEQYRHPTRDPETYWKEVLKKDPYDSRSLTALGKRALSRGEFQLASEYLTKAVKRITNRHPNPITGEAHYNLGLAQSMLGNTSQAYNLFYKATWNYEWRSCSYYKLATLDCQNRQYETALNHLEESLNTNRQNNKAIVLKAIILRHLDRKQQALSTLDQLLEIDALDHWARYEKLLLTDSGSEAFLTTCRNDAQTILDLVFDYTEAGFYHDALALLEFHHSKEVLPVAVPNPLETSPMTRYAEAWIKHLIQHPAAAEALATASASSADHFFPSRHQEMQILQWASETSADDSVAAYALGNFYYDKRLHQAAITSWEQAVAANTTIPQVYRNLGIAYWNQQQDGEKAAEYYQKAVQLSPQDARFISEFDQLSQKRNRPVNERLTFLEKNLELVLLRDDATVALTSLYNLTNQSEKALELLTTRRFHPWEGGEGAVLRQYTSARLRLGQQALDQNNPELALEQFDLAMQTPQSLGEAYHPLQAKADVNYWKGMALKQLGKADEAASHFQLSAAESGDFSAMAATEHSPLSYYRGRSLQELNKPQEAEALFNELLSFASEQLNTKATIDYFATSLPNLLVFDEDLQAGADAEAHLLIGLAHHGLGNADKATEYFNKTLQVVCHNDHAVFLTT